MSIEVDVVRVFTDANGHHGNALGIVDAASVPAERRQGLAAIDLSQARLDEVRRRPLNRLGGLHLASLRAALWAIYVETGEFRLGMPEAAAEIDASPLAGPDSAGRRTSDD